MTKISLLDCTLREAPVKNLMHGSDFIEKFIRSLENSGIDIIETGFLKDVNYQKGSSIFSSPEQIEPYLKHKKENILYVALVDYGRFSVENLPACSGKSIDAIRICFKKFERNAVIEYAKSIRAKGYKICIQCVDTLGYSDEELRAFIEQVNVLHPYAFSIVDTFGGMYPRDIAQKFELVNKILKSDICLGFHGHNNLQLASANAQYFIELALNKREHIIVDASMMGCGRGAGNALSELLIEYLNKYHHARYSENQVLDLLQNLMPELLTKANFGYSIPYFLSGKNASHVFNVDYLSQLGLSYNQMWNVISNLSAEDKKLYKYDVLDKLVEGIKKGA